MMQSKDGVSVATLKIGDPLEPCRYSPPPHLNPAAPQPAPLGLMPRSLAGSLSVCITACTSLFFTSWPQLRSCWDVPHSKQAAPVLSSRCWANGCSDRGRPTLKTTPGFPRAPHGSPSPMISLGDPLILTLSHSRTTFSAGPDCRAGFCFGLWSRPVPPSGKEPTCPSRRHKTCGFDLRVGNIPLGKTRQPTAVFLPGESHGQRSLAGYRSIGTQRVRHS